MLGSTVETETQFEPVELPQDLEPLEPSELDQFDEFDEFAPPGADPREPSRDDELLPTTTTIR
jgi:hypothetical protein